MKFKFYSALLIMVSVFSLEAQQANPPATLPAQNQTVVQNQIDVKTPIADNQANTPVGSLSAFQKGQLFYHATPQTPAIGTSLKIIDSK